MIPIHFVFYSDLGEDVEEAFRAVSVSEYEDVSFSVEHVTEFKKPEGQLPVLITTYTSRLKKVEGHGFRTVFCAETDQLGGASFDVLWPAKESVEERTEHFRELLRLLVAEHRAWEYRMLLDATINTVQDMLWYKRTDGIHMLVNDSFAKTVHKDKRDIAGKDHYEVWDVPRPKANEEPYDCSESERISIRSGKTCSFEESVATREGMKHITTYKTPIYDSFGHVYGTVGVGHDVTNLSNLGIELSLLVENIPVPMFIAMPDWTIVRMNTAFMGIAKVEEATLEEFDFPAWKKENLLPMKEPVVNRKHHTVEQEFESYIDGERHIYILTEHVVHDYFGNASGYLCLMRDITINRVYEQEVTLLASTDGLTGLYNRRYFYKYLTEQASKLWMLLYMDLDGFKGVNDLLGHRRGDEVLIQTAGLLKEIFPVSKCVRLGGDEFAVLIEEDLQEGVLQEKIKELENRVEMLIPEEPDMLSISVGVVARRGELTDIDAFIHEGDSRMYEIKRRHHEERKRRRKIFAPRDGSEMVQLRYMESFRNTFIEMEGIPWSENDEKYDHFNALCKMLRIARVEVITFANPEKEHENDGRIEVKFADGEADERRFMDRRNVTHGFNIVFVRAWQKLGDADWNEAEKEGVDLVLRMLFVLKGRRRLMHLAERLSFLDQSLDIKNHKFFMQSLERLYQQNKISNYTAMHLNLRRFSVVNQRLGRNLGTEVMKRYAKTIEAALSGDEMIARLGGDKFTLLVEKDHAEDILDLVREMMVVYDDSTGDRVRVTTSVGIYELPEDGTASSPSEIMDRITRVGQRARSGNDGQVVYYDAVMTDLRARELDIEANFRDALEKEEFEVMYQPKVGMESYIMTGAEALCRWNHNGRTALPDDFIPLLEQSMEICALDMYMLDHVCRDIRKWLDEGRRVPRISVNLSRRNLADADLLQHIIGILDRHQVPHHYLEIELTETAMDVQFGDLKKIVEGIREAGITASVDDFGVGYSSLTLIRDIPWDVLKIDRSFLPAEGDALEVQKTLMFRYVVAMAQSMGLKCLVEGIETSDQLRLIQQNGCDEAQGFFFDRPLSRTDFEQRMDSSDYARIAGSSGVW